MTGKKKKQRGNVRKGKKGQRKIYTEKQKGDTERNVDTRGKSETTKKTEELVEKNAEYSGIIDGGSAAKRENLKGGKRSQRGEFKFMDDRDRRGQ